MLKRIIKFNVYCAFILFCGCYEGEKKPTVMELQHYQDSLSEARIDSAYAAIKTACDTMMIYQVPKMVDSLLKDSALLKTFFKSKNVYSYADKKAEKVISQLLSDCDSSLLKETYRRARLRQKLKPVLRKKRKA